MDPKTPRIKNVVFFDPYPKGLNHYQLMSLKPSLFVKYFPKYLKNLTIDYKDGAVKSKIKRTKVIQDFKSAEYCTTSSHWRSLLSNKMKSVKSLSNQFQSTSLFIEKVKLFSRLQSISLFPLETVERKLFKEGSEAMLRLQKLKSLNVHIGVSPIDSSHLLKDLDSLPRLLKSLKTLNIHSIAPEYEFPTLVEVMKNNCNILQYMTSFSIGQLSGPEQHQAFKTLADCFPNLRHLSFEFSCRKISWHRGRVRKYAQTRLPAHSNCLQTLKAFPNLKSLDLRIADNEAFLSHFALPPGVRSLSLVFDEDLTHEFLGEIHSHLLPENVSQLSGESRTFSKFFEVFEQLESLEALKLTFNKNSRQESYAYENQLSQCILRRLPSLKKFTFAVKDSYVATNEDSNKPPIQNYSLTELLGSCSRTLETLEIETYEKILSSEHDFSSFQGQFPNLKAIRFNEGSCEDDPRLIGSYLQQMISLGNSITKIEFTTLFEAEGFLLGLFDELEKAQIPNKLELLLKIKPIQDPQSYVYFKCPQRLINKGKLEEKPCLGIQGSSPALFMSGEVWLKTGLLKTLTERVGSMHIIYRPRD